MEIPFQTIDWKDVPGVTHPGEKGEAVWQTQEWPGIRFRLVTYSPGYHADHWCAQGHIVHCIDGEFTSELDSGATFRLKTRMSYVVSDNQSVHRSFTETGARLLILDGKFLQTQ